MFCERCGKEIEITPDSRFCPGCGLEYQWQPVQTKTPPPTPQEIVARNHIQPIKYGNNDNQQVVMEKIGTSIDNRQKAGKTATGIFFLIILVPVAIGGFIILLGLIALIL